MTTLRGSVKELVSVDAEKLFALVTDVDRLPEWNEHIHHVVDASAGELRVGDEWVVETRAMGSKWDSRARAQEIDRSNLRFAYRSQTDDGNPSFALWTWSLTPMGEGAEIAVEWELHAKTFWRSFLLSRIRHRQLKEEVRTSVRAAANAVSDNGVMT